MIIKHIIPSYYPKIGGAERQLNRLANIQSKNHKLEIITRNLLNKKPLFKENVNNNLRILRLGFGDIYSFNLLLFLYLFVNKPKYLHLHTLTSPFFVSSIYARIFGIKIFAKVTRYGIGSQIESISKSFLKKKLFIILCRSCVKMVCLTKPAFKYVKRLNLGARLVLIPNGIQPNNNFSKSLSETNIINLAIISRLIPRKRVYITLKLLLDKFGEKLNIHVCGDGTERTKIENLISKLKTKNVYMHGMLNENEVNEILRKSNFMILNSENEGLSNSFLEAINNGTIPVVNYNEFYHDLNNRFDCILDFNLMLNMSIDELKNYYHKNKLNLNKIIRSEFDINKIEKKYIKLYYET